jgi:hypothetical protein
MIGLYMLNFSTVEIRRDGTRFQTESYHMLVHLHVMLEELCFVTKHVSFYDWNGTADPAGRK